MTDDEEYELWKQQGGVDPKTGKMWLTKRMEKNAMKLQKIWDEDEKVKEALRIWKKENA